MIEVSNEGRIVFPELGTTKGEVVAYYDAVASRIFAHVRGRPLSIKRYPKGIAEPGFFQKNVPAHYPAAIQRFPVPRSSNASKKHPPRRGKASPAPDTTLYPLLTATEQIAYLANQGAIELHVPTARADLALRADRIVIDLDPPSGAVGLVRHSARLVRAALDEYGLPTVPVATGSKGYHLVAAIEPTLEPGAVALAAQQFAALVAARHPDTLTTSYRVALRGGRVFIDWLRNMPLASVVAPYSLRATARAGVAVPIEWAELDMIEPNTFSITDLPRLLDRSDPLAELTRAPTNASPFVSAVERAFDAAGLELETFDRFRS
jgi:bifunctional non-homologous end joining protein LigD